MQAVEESRALLAELIGAEDPSEITFTSGATEANNWVLNAFDSYSVSPFEHSSVREPAIAAGQEILDNHGYWLVGAATPLVSVMSVNNETGAILDPPVGTAKIHRDITQAVGKLPIDLAGIDYASSSGHKIYGPKGVGALFVKGGDQIEPLLRGGGQEKGLRAGTLNVPGIVGFGEAARVALGEMEGDAARANELRRIVLDGLGPVSDWRENSAARQSPYILSVSFAGLEGQPLVEELDRRGFAVSSGAACSSGSTEPSHVLTALGVESVWLRGTLRISFGRTNTHSSAQALSRAIVETVESVRKLHK